MSDTMTISYLKNFFAKASEDQISKYINGLDPTTQSILKVLIKTNIQAQEAVKKLSQSQKVPTSIPRKIDSSKQLEKDIKLLRSSTYNARLYLIYQEIIRRWKASKQPISRNRIFEEMGQETPIKSFDEALLYGDTSTKTAQVIHKCFQQYYRDDDVFIIPTDYGKELFEFDLTFYSIQTTSTRFDKANQMGWFSKSKVALLVELASNDYTNSIEDKKKLGEVCNLHPDNISRTITQLNQMGFINRLPSKWDSKHFNIEIFDKQKISELI